MGAGARTYTRAEVRAEVDAKVRAKAKARGKAKVRVKVRAKVRARARARARAGARARARARARAKAKARARARVRSKAKGGDGDGASFFLRALVLFVCSVFGPRPWWRTTCGLRAATSPPQSKAKRNGQTLVPEPMWQAAATRQIENTVFLKAAPCNSEVPLLQQENDWTNQGGRSGGKPTAKLQTANTTKHRIILG